MSEHIVSIIDTLVSEIESARIEIQPETPVSLFTSRARQNKRVKIDFDKLLQNDLYRDQLSESASQELDRFLLLPNKIIRLIFLFIGKVSRTHFVEYMR